MGRRRRPETFSAWLIGVVGGLLITWFSYQHRVHRIEQIANHQLDRMEHLRPKVDAPTPPTPEQIAAHQAEMKRQAEYEKNQQAIQRRLAAEELRKQEAWEKYFVPTSRCQLPESQSMVQVCEANESKHRARFEAQWSKNEGSQL